MVRRQQRDTTTPTRVYDAAKEVVKRGEAKAGVALPANVSFYDASRTSTGIVGFIGQSSSWYSNTEVLIPPSPCVSDHHCRTKAETPHNNELVFYCREADKSCLVHVFLRHTTTAVI